jgi:hypothetical protein
MRLTIIYAGYEQVTQDTFADRYRTKFIELTEEQKKQINDKRKSESIYKIYLEEEGE